MKRIFYYFLVPLVILIFFMFLFREKVRYYFFAPMQIPPSVEIKTDNTPQVSKNIETIAQNLEIPWEIAFLPNGEMLVTERSGKLLKIGLETKVIKEIEGVKHIGEGGLLGLAIHPNFSENNFIYLYFSSFCHSWGAKLYRGSG